MQGVNFAIYIMPYVPGNTCTHVDDATPMVLLDARDCMHAYIWCIYMSDEEDQSRADDVRGVVRDHVHAGVAAAGSGGGGGGLTSVVGVAPPWNCSMAGAVHLPQYTDSVLLISPCKKKKTPY
jgi:hypothetical protein